VKNVIENTLSLYWGKTVNQMELSSLSWAMYPYEDIFVKRWAFWIFIDNTITSGGWQGYCYFVMPLFTWLRNAERFWYKIVSVAEPLHLALVTDLYQYWKAIPPYFPSLPPPPLSRMPPNSFLFILSPLPNLDFLSRRLVGFQPNTMKIQQN
jgi:hypothetical protein